MLVSVIVPVYNDAARLARCLAALADQTWPLREVIVVDNGSDPPLAAPPGVRLVVERRPGSYAARNAGAAAAAGAILAFTDADCIPARDWLERGVAALAAADYVAGAIAVTTRARASAGELCERATAFPQRRFLEQLRFGATANVLVTRTAFAAVGGFDASLMSAGDVDFGERVHAAGLRQVYAAGARVEHPARASLLTLCKKIVRTESGLRDLEAARARRAPGYRPRRRPVVPELMPIAQVPARAAPAMAFLVAFRSAVAAAVNAGLRPELRRIWG